MTSVVESAADQFVPSVLDADVAPDDVAAWAAAVTPGSAVVTPLAAVKIERLSEAGLVDCLVAVEKQLAWLQARSHRIIATMARRSAAASFDELNKSWVREDVAAALRVSPAAAGDRLGLAAELARLPGTLDALERADVDAVRARVLAEATIALDAATAADLEARVLPHARDGGVAAFRRRVARAALTLAPKSADEQHADAMEQRRVVVRPSAAGMSELWALLPADGAAGLLAAIDALAGRKSADEERSADQRRADALVQLGIDALSGEQSDVLPRHLRTRPAVQVSVALSTLIGLDDQPGELAGYGPIPATLARKMADDPSGTWRRLVTDERGRLRDYGRTTYRPRAALADHVMARDQTCRFPTCARSARRCELDHRVPWRAGGTTSAHNLDALCSRHHHLKDEAGWRTRRDRDGSLSWTSVTGHGYRCTTDAYPVDSTIDRCVPEDHPVDTTIDRCVPEDHPVDATIDGNESIRGPDPP